MRRLRPALLLLASLLLIAAAVAQPSPCSPTADGAVTISEFVIDSPLTDVISLGPNNSVRFLRCAGRCPELMHSKWTLVDRPAQLFWEFILEWRRRQELRQGQR